MENKKYFLIFKLYLILALINIFYTFYVKLNYSFDYNKFASNLLNGNFHPTFLTILFGFLAY